MVKILNYFDATNTYVNFSFHPFCFFPFPRETIRKMKECSTLFVKHFFLKEGQDGLKFFQSCCLSKDFIILFLANSPLLLYVPMVCGIGVYNVKTTKKTFNEKAK